MIDLENHHETCYRKWFLNYEPHDTAYWKLKPMGTSAECEEYFQGKSSVLRGYDAIYGRMPTTEQHDSTENPNGANDDASAIP